MVFTLLVDDGASRYLDIYIDALSRSHYARVSMYVISSFNFRRFTSHDGAFDDA